MLTCSDEKKKGFYRTSIPSVFLRKSRRLAQAIRLFDHYTLFDQMMKRDLRFIFFLQDNEQILFEIFSLNQNDNEPNRFGHEYSYRFKAVLNM